LANLGRDIHGLLKKINHEIPEVIQQSMGSMGSSYNNSRGGRGSFNKGRGGSRGGGDSFYNGNKGRRDQYDNSGNTNYGVDRNENRPYRNERNDRNDRSDNKFNSNSYDDDSYSRF